MPAPYEKFRDSLIKKGVDRDEAEERAAKWWNKHHPDNPVGRGHHGERSKKKSKK